MECKNTSLHIKLVDVGEGQFTCIRSFAPRLFPTQTKNLTANNEKFGGGLAGNEASIPSFCSCQRTSMALWLARPTIRYTVL